MGRCCSSGVGGWITSCNMVVMNPVLHRKRKSMYTHLERSEIWCGHKEVLKQVLLVTKTNAYMLRK